MEKEIEAIKVKERDLCVKCAEELKTISLGSGDIFSFTGTGRGAFYCENKNCDLYGKELEHPLLLRENLGDGSAELIWQFILREREELLKEIGEFIETLKVNSTLEKGRAYTPAEMGTILAGAGTNDTVERVQYYLSLLSQKEEVVGNEGEHE